MLSLLLLHDSSSTTRCRMMYVCGSVLLMHGGGCGAVCQAGHRPGVPGEQSVEGKDNRPRGPRHDRVEDSVRVSFIVCVWVVLAGHEPQLPRHVAWTETSPAHAPTRTHTHVHTHAPTPHTHTRTHARTHTHTHTHTQLNAAQRTRLVVKSYGRSSHGLRLRCCRSVHFRARGDGTYEVTLVSLPGRVLILVVVDG
jgi:hypothetical protein